MHCAVMDVSQENNGFGPLSEKRGKRGIYASLFALVVSILCTMAISSDNLHFCGFSFALSTLAIFFGEIVRRLCLLMEEIRHKNSRYKGSWEAVLKTTFRFNGGKTVVVCVIFMVCLAISYLRKLPHSITHSQYMALIILNIGIVPLALYLIGLRELSPIEVSELNERENKNVADGLAWSYYYGYLKLVLPHLEQQINKTEKYRFKIKVQKVFILLPKNCFFPPNGKISEADDRIKLAGPLEELKITRGGIHNRSYKHTVHCIEMPKPGSDEVEQYYCLAEYATPLMTLYDMSENPEAALTKDERDQQCMVFIRKLREILKSDKDCRGKFELVTMSGEGTDIADILVRHLKAPRIPLDN